MDKTNKTSVIDRAFRGLVSDDDKPHLVKALLSTAARDREAFHDVYRLTSPALFCICMRICRDRASAEAVLCDAYLAVWEVAGTWDPEQASPMVWLARITTKLAVDCRRSQMARPRERGRLPDDISECPNRGPGFWSEHSGRKARQ